MKWRGQLDSTFVVKKDEQKKIVISEAGTYTVELIGAGAQAEISGAFLAEKKDDIEIHLFVMHKAAHTSAQATLKGVAKEQSHIKFFGRIQIAPNCPDTHSFLEERILLLSDQAKAEAIPELEILSNDVKCSHAASVSRIPEEHLFYLQSRGLKKNEAEELIIQGFLDLDFSF